MECLRRHFCSGITVSIKYYECVCVCVCVCVWILALVIRQVYCKIFGEKPLNIKCVLIFSTNVVQNTSHSQKDSVRYNVTCTWVFMLIAHYFFHNWSYLNSLDRFSVSSNIKFNWIPFRGSRDVPCGWTDRHDKANIHYGFIKTSLMQIV